MNNKNFKNGAPSYSSVKYYVADQMLMASFSPNTLDKPLNKNSLIQLLETVGLQNHDLDDENLQKLVEHSVSNHEGVVELDKHIAASFILTISQDKMSATIRIIPAKGGHRLNYKDVLESLLKDLNIEFIDKKLLAESLRNNQEIPTIIARGVASIDGEDSKFEMLFNAETKLALAYQSDTAINHYESHQYITVEKNQPLMKRLPHTRGTSGYNVLGEAIVAKNGREIPFAKNDTTEVDKTDANLLIATKNGHPIAINHGVHIDETLTLKNANYLTGNIRFDGSINITGDVLPNIKIEASGDVFINGIVDNASIIAGNNITIGSGIISRPLHDADGKENFSSGCLLKAEKTIMMEYCNRVTASAKEDILIKNYSMHSNLNCGGHLIFGNNNGKGVVIGGTSYADYTITANVIGSDGYVRTDVGCGSFISNQIKYDKIVDKVVRSKKELSFRKDVLKNITNTGSPTTVGKKSLNNAKIIHQEIIQIESDISKLETELLHIRNELKLRKKAKITIHNKLYANVHLSINDVNDLTDKNHEASIIYIEDHLMHYQQN